MPGPIIWPLREKLRPTLFSQQRPNWTGGLLIPFLPINAPWNVVSVHTRGINDIATAYPSVVHELKPIPPQYFKITGTTKNSSGVALGSCTVDWFDSATDIRIDTTTSDANGAFEFRTAGQPPNAYYLVSYKAGSPDVAGTTVNTLYGI